MERLEDEYGEDAVYSLGCMPFEQIEQVEDTIARGL